MKTGMSKVSKKTVGVFSRLSQFNASTVSSNITRPIVRSSTANYRTDTAWVQMSEAGNSLKHNSQKFAARVNKRHCTSNKTVRISDGKDIFAVKDSADKLMDMLALYESSIEDDENYDDYTRIIREYYYARKSKQEKEKGHVQVTLPQLTLANRQDSIKTIKELDNS